MKKLWFVALTLAVTAALSSDPVQTKERKPHGTTKNCNNCHDPLNPEGPPVR